MMIDAAKIDAAQQSNYFFIRAFNLFFKCEIGCRHSLKLITRTFRILLTNGSTRQQQFEFAIIFFSLKVSTVYTNLRKIRF